MRKKINKILNKIEIFLGREKLWSYPRYIQLEPTNRCNQKCIMCPRNESDFDVPFGDMPFDDYLKILNQIPTITNMQLNGLGEPLLHPRIFDMLKEANRRGIKTSINSNVALIDSIEKAKRLVDSGLDLLKVSMDTADPKVYQNIRQSDTFNQVIEAIKLIVKARGSKYNPQIWFNSIIMKNNYKDLGEILKLGNKLGIDLVRFKPLNVFWAGSDSDLIAETEALKKEISKTIKLAEGLKVKHNLKELLVKLDKGFYKRPKENIPCYSPWLELYIQYYGGVRLCCEFYSKKHDIGNILEQGFGSVWNRPKMRQIRKEFKKGNTYFPACKICNRFSRNIAIYNKMRGIRGL